MTRLLRDVALGATMLAVAVAAATSQITHSGAATVPGAAGVDTSLAPTESKVVVRGRGTFEALEVTVNQTRKLVNQAVSVTWSGGAPTISASKRFHGNYLQIMQCWGEDDGTVPGNPGPPPEQCVQGATAATSGGVPTLPFPSGFQLSRIISRSSWEGADPSIGELDPVTGNVWRPFRGVDGKEIGIHEDPAFNPEISGGDFWLNTYFNIVTTNEVAGSATGPNGRGAELFEVVTGVESSGLGCGQKVQPVAGGQPKEPKCWLVIVPRGTPAEENVGTPNEEDADQAGVITSPLAPSAWRNRIAIPLEFNPVESACSIDEDDRRIVGNELVLAAMASWQRTLCATPGLPPYSYATTGDSAARLQLASPAPGGPGMVVASRPLAPAEVNPDNPVVYAPLAANGVVVGFNVERVPDTEAPAEAKALEGVRVAELNLTPRLVAKLLTQSYRSQVEIHDQPEYEWLEDNPRHLGEDPDFLRFNPEFEMLEVRNAKTFGGLALPAGNADAARQVWEWVLADPEAAAWLEGAPDDWGMQVNAVYATSAAINSTGAPFGDPPPDSFPKSDPYCYEGPPGGTTGEVVPPVLCGTDWLPYSRSMADAARSTRAADDGAKTSANPSAASPDRMWVRDSPQFLGTRAFLSITDSASAARYGVQTARLSRAGDNRADRSFVAADVAGLTAGIAAMKPEGDSKVLVPDLAADAPTAYPLTALSYAAATPLTLDEAARRDYAAFLAHAADAGQTVGLEAGQLPRGYAPLPPALRAQTAAAVEAIRAPKAPAVPPGPEEVTGAPAEAAAAALPVGPTAPAFSTDPAPSFEPPPVPLESGGSMPVTVTPPAGPTPRDEIELSTQRTPQVSISSGRYVVPSLAAVALLAAWFALELTKRPRLARRPPAPAMAEAG